MVASATPNPLNNPGDHEHAVAHSSQATPLRRQVTALRLLVVDPDPSTAALVRQVLGAGEARPGTRRPTGTAKTCVYSAAGASAASQALTRLAARGEAVHLIIAEENQVSSDAGALPDLVERCANEARLVIVSNSPTLAGCVTALRRGALDYLPKPLARGTLADRLRSAAARQQLLTRDARRMSRLKQAVRQLNEARRTVGKKVDLLCQDLVGAYSDLAKQVERLRVGGHLTRLLESAADLEQLLCHMMDWVLRELGHCNIAIFLTDDEGASELGAYMKHTIAGDERTVQWLRTHVIPLTGQDGLLYAGATAMKPLGGQNSTMQQQTIISVDCTYLAESLATLIVFRKPDKPFGGDELALLKAAGPVFATALTNLIRGGEPQKKQRADEDEWWRRSA